jgi:hypothetical protein
MKSLVVAITQYVLAVTVSFGLNIAYATPSWADPVTFSFTGADGHGFTSTGSLQSIVPFYGFLARADLGERWQEWRGIGP